MWYCPALQASHQYMNPIEEIAAPATGALQSALVDPYRPVVMRGAAAEWPLVQAGKQSTQTALDYVTWFDNGKPTDVMVAPPAENGRFFYSPDMRGFNFQRQQGTLSSLLSQLPALAERADSPAVYAGAAAIASHLPGLEAQNTLPVLADAGGTARIWIGTASQVAIHFDMSDNIAVVALGRRTFTLFPPEATGDLYVGPLNHTPAGQPVSMVDPLNPDMARYPRYAAAQEHAQQAVLEPGDAIYIPTLWWHHVQASDPVNILVNTWFNDAPRGGGFLALVHAMMSIRDLPPTQREAWRAWFDHFVFGDAAPDAADHLPLPARGVNGPASPERSEMIRRFVAQILSSP